MMTFALVGGSSSARADDLTDKVDALLSKWNRSDSPGCAIGIIKNGNLIYARGYGMANLAQGIPNKPETVFRIGSESKQFTAACILLLEDEGKLSIEDGIRKFIPSLPKYADQIKIRHLIHHTSGLRDYPGLALLSGIRDPDFMTDEEALALLMRQKSLNFHPGDEFQYSNSGYFLLGVICRKASGLSLSKFAKEKLFSPLGMQQTHFHDDPSMVVENLADGHSADENGFSVRVTRRDQVGPAGVMTTVNDLFRWDQNFYDPKVGGPNFVARMLAPAKLNNGQQVQLMWQGRPVNATYASGLEIKSYRGLKMVHHGGGWRGYLAEVVRFPDEKFSVICLSNLDQFNPFGLCPQIADIYLADAMRPGSTDTDTPPAERPTYEQMHTARELQDFAATYHSDELDIDYTFEVRDGSLWLASVKEIEQMQLESVDQRRFRPIGATTSTWLWHGLTFDFAEKQDGRISGLVLDHKWVRGIRFYRQ